MLMAPPVMQVLIQGRNGCFPNLATGQKTKHKTEQNALSVPVKGMQAPNTHSCLINWVSKVNTRTGRDTGSQPPPPKHIPCSSFYPPCPPLPPPHIHPLQQSSHGENSLQAPGSWKEAGRREGVGKEGGRQAHGDTHQTWRPNVHAQEVGQEARGSSLTQEP